MYFFLSESLRFIFYCLAETKVYLSDGYHGMVTIERYGINGTVCGDGWDEREANVTCQNLGYAGGVVLGPPEVYSRSLPVWYTNFSCNGLEDSLTDCEVNTTIPLSCVQSIKNAGVLCYNGTGNTCQENNCSFI